MQKALKVLVVVGLVAWMASSAAAAVVVFSGFDVGAGSADPRPNSNITAASFDAAAGGLGTLNIITFEGVPVGPANGATVFAGVTTSGPTTSTIRNTPFGSPDRLFGYNTTLGGSNFLSLSGNDVTFNFTSPIQAFGLYASGLQLDFETLTFSDGSTQTVPIPLVSSSDGGIAFVGFTDVGASIIAVTYTAQSTPSIGDIVGLDDVRFVTTAQTGVPEAGSLAVWLLLGSVGALAVSRARRS